MELVFLKRSTLAYLDHAYVADFDILVDMVVNQKSSFTINCGSVDAEVGDIAVLRGAPITYIGLVESLTTNDDGTMKVQANDIREAFDIDVPAGDYSGDLCVFLEQLVTEAFTSTGDSVQDMPYLTVERRTSAEGSLVYGDDSLVSILDLMELLAKSYGVITRFEAVISNGDYSGIKMAVEDIGRSSSLRYDLRAISNLELKDSAEYTTNKLVYYPKSDNTAHRTAEPFYLLTDGTVTQNQDDTRRYGYVSLRSEYYSDDDYDNLGTKARSELGGSSDDHEITFELCTDNSVYVPLGDIYLGSPVEFIAKRKTYHTLLTKIRYKGTFATASVTLGEQRTSLTDKIKMLSGTGTGNSTSVGVAASDTDGGEY